MKVHIDAKSRDPQRPHDNLVPIVDALVAAGNSIRHDFHPTMQGPECLLRDAIDFDLVSEMFDLPPNVELFAQLDSIGDQLTWVGIQGGEGWRRVRERGFEIAFEDLARLGVPVELPRDARIPDKLLTPIVGVLVAGGNRFEDTNWYDAQSGPMCRLRDALDFELVRQAFVIPDGIELREDEDRIVDTTTGYFIEGRVTSSPRLR